MCSACAAGIHWECYDPLANNPDTFCCCPNLSSTDLTTAIREQNKRGGQTKVNEDVTDPKSTGRKRAAVLYPLDSDEQCEWKELKSAGGGKYPIIGCIDGKQKNRHHGPDKDTLNNDEGNVHRICPHCHNRWHTKNDPDYDPKSEDCKVHDPETKATPEELVRNEMYWSTRKVERAHDH
jgi:hypothetical protein